MTRYERDEARIYDNTLDAGWTLFWLALVLNGLWLMRTDDVLHLVGMVLAVLSPAGAYIAGMAWLHGADMPDPRLLTATELTPRRDLLFQRIRDRVVAICSIVVVISTTLSLLLWLLGAILNG